MVQNKTKYLCISALLDDDDSSAPLQWRKQEDVTFRVAECAEVPSKVPFQWRKQDAVP